MPGFDGTGPGGMGPMTGGGRGFCSPLAGRRYYAFPRRTPYAYPGYGAYAQCMNRQQELEFLKGQAEALRKELGELEAEINKISPEKE